MSEMLCARPACEEKENRINGYCSVYCEDVGELEKENTALKRELKYWKDAHSVLSEVTYNRNAALKRGLQNIKDSFIGPRAKTSDLRQMIDTLLAQDQEDA